MCVYLSIINIHTHISCKQKRFIFDAINRLTAQLQTISASLDAEVQSLLLLLLKHDNSCVLFVVLYLYSYCYNYEYAFNVYNFFN